MKCEWCGNELYHAWVLLLLLLFLIIFQSISQSLSKRTPEVGMTSRLVEKHLCVVRRRHLLTLNPNFVAKFLDCKKKKNIHIIVHFPVLLFMLNFYYIDTNYLSIYYWSFPSCTKHIYYWSFPSWTKHIWCCKKVYSCLLSTPTLVKKLSFKKYMLYTNSCFYLSQNSLERWSWTVAL